MVKPPPIAPTTISTAPAMARMMAIDVGIGAPIPQDEGASFLV
jgi:hypothetical protein